MEMEEIKMLLKTSSYNFLREDTHLNNNIILLGLGGSLAYGTNLESGGDIDLRGIALNSKEEILLSKDFEQVLETNTDTVIYSFNKMINLLTKCNPNTIECVGLKPEHYFYISSIGQEILDNKEMFLSKLAVHSFGGYAANQARRLDNKAVRTVEQSKREQHILNSIKNASVSFKDHYFEYPEDAIKLYIDTAIQSGYDTEIFMDINLTHYPLRDYKCMYSEMANIVKDYGKLGKRNKRAAEHGKLAKHMCHLVRLFYMAFDILEKHEINTYRKDEHDLLLSIRKGDYLDSNNQPVPQFYEMVDELEKRLNYDAENTDLPEIPDYKRINEFIASVNERIVKEEI